MDQNLGSTEMNQNVLKHQVHFDGSYLKILYISGKVFTVKIRNKSGNLVWTQHLDPY